MMNTVRLGLRPRSWRAHQDPLHQQLTSEVLEKIAKPCRHPQESIARSGNQHGSFSKCTLCGTRWHVYVLGAWEELPLSQRRPLPQPSGTSAVGPAWGGGELLFDIAEDIYEDTAGAWSQGRSPGHGGATASAKAASEDPLRSTLEAGDTNVDHGLDEVTAYEGMPVYKQVHSDHRIDIIGANAGMGRIIGMCRDYGLSALQPLTLEDSVKAVYKFKPLCVLVAPDF